MYKLLTLALLTMGCGGGKGIDTSIPPTTNDAVECQEICESEVCGAMFWCTFPDGSDIGFLGSLDGSFRFDCVDSNCSDMERQTWLDFVAQCVPCGGLYTTGTTTGGTTGTATGTGTCETGPPFGKGGGNGP